MKKVMFIFIGLFILIYTVGCNSLINRVDSIKDIQFGKTYEEFSIAESSLVTNEIAAKQSVEGISRTLQVDDSALYGVSSIVRYDFLNDTLHQVRIAPLVTDKDESDKIFKDILEKISKEIGEKCEKNSFDEYSVCVWEKDTISVTIMLFNDASIVEPILIQIQQVCE